MALKLRKRPADVKPKQACPSGASGDDSRPEPDHRNVMVTHGILSGRYPVGGLRVREARRVLQKLINIHPTAVAVINGAPVDEATVIDENVTLLSFVKPSSLKG